MELPRRGPRPVLRWSPRISIFETLDIQIRGLPLSMPQEALSPHPVHFLPPEIFPFPLKPVI